jgi:hypothetical protein
MELTASSNVSSLQMSDKADNKGRDIAQIICTNISHAFNISATELRCFFSIFLSLVVVRYLTCFEIAT